MLRYSNDEIIRQLGDETDLWCPSQNTSAKASEVIGDKVVVFYFSADWCPPCRRFTRELMKFYERLKSKPDVEDFEVVFISMDKRLKEYQKYAGRMPWWSMPFEAESLAMLRNIYGMTGIPCLVVVDKNGRVISLDGVGLVMSDPMGEKFPWRPKPCRLLCW